MIQARSNQAPAGRMVIDGQEVAFRRGETILDAASRAGRDIPTLCHDSRLKPNGCCRMCLVEIEGWPRMAPACATAAGDGASVTTESDRIDRHRRTLVSMYLSDQPEHDHVATARPNELHALADRFAADRDWPRLISLRPARREDPNPFIYFNEETCILCARCTRYCDEVEGVSAITLAGRGPETTIATADGLSLLDTTCELCGGCIDVCPTGAMTEKLLIKSGARPRVELERVRTTCNYCGVGCQMDLLVDRVVDGGRGQVVAVDSPPPGTTVNDGNLCVKGRFAYEFIHHEERLTAPMIRGDDGQLHEASWEDAIAAAAAGLLGVRERHGADALGLVSSSRCTGEENYLVQKFARAVMGTNNVHQCAAT